MIAEFEIGRCAFEAGETNGRQRRLNGLPAREEDMRVFNASTVAAVVMLATSTPALADVNADARLCRDAIAASSELEAANYRVKFESAKGGRVRVLRFKLSPSTDAGEPLKALCTIENGSVTSLRFE